MEELREIIREAMHNDIFKWTLGTIVTTLTSWALIAVRNANKKLKNAPTKEDLAKLKDDAFKYTDSRIELHEKDHKPILQEIATVKAHASEINSKVDKLLLLMIEKK